VNVSIELRVLGTSDMSYKDESLFKLYIPIPPITASFPIHDLLMATISISLYRPLGKTDLSIATVVKNDISTLVFVLLA